jgi:hypothetical protein
VEILGPKRPDDPRLGWPCAECGERFVVGDVTAAVGEEPADEVEAERARLDMPFVKRLREVHVACAAKAIRSQRRPA